MPEDSDPDLEKLKIFMQLQQNEINYHWSRNNYFLLMSSILLVALAQLKGRSLELFVGIVGLSLNSVWLLIQFNSNRYIKYWNAMMNEFGKKAGLPPFYSSKGLRIPVRAIVLILPLPFLALWIFVIILSILGIGI